MDEHIRSILEAKGYDPDKKFTSPVGNEQTYWQYVEAAIMGAMDDIDEAEES